MGCKKFFFLDTRKLVLGYRGFFFLDIKKSFLLAKKFKKSKRKKKKHMFLFFLIFLRGGMWQKNKNLHFDFFEKIGIFLIFFIFNFFLIFGFFPPLSAQCLFTLKYLILGFRVFCIASAGHSPVPAHPLPQDPLPDTLPRSPPSAGPLLRRSPQNVVLFSPSSACLPICVWEHHFYSQHCSRAPCHLHGKTNARKCTEKRRPHTEHVLVQ